MGRFNLGVFLELDGSSWKLGECYRKSTGYSCSALALAHTSTVRLLAAEHRDGGTCSNPLWPLLQCYDFRKICGYRQQWIELKCGFCTSSECIFSILENKSFWVLCKLVATAWHCFLPVLANVQPEVSDVIVKRHGLKWFLSLNFGASFLPVSSGRGRLTMHFIGNNGAQCLSN